MDILHIVYILMILLMQTETKDVFCHFDICTVGEQFCNNYTRICNPCQMLETYCHEKSEDTSCLMLQCFKKEEQKLNEAIQLKDDQIDDLKHLIETKDGELLHQKEINIALFAIIAVLAVLLVIVGVLYINQRYRCISKVKSNDSLQGSREISNSSEIESSDLEQANLLEDNGEESVKVQKYDTGIPLESDIKLDVNGINDEESVEEQRSKYPPNNIQPTDGNCSEKATMC